MRYLRGICRFTIGVIFILSGFLKAIDPIGNSLKIEEYLKVFHLDFLDIISLPAAVLLSTVEFVIGVCILKGLKIRLFSKIALFFVSFFTLLTLYSAIFNPVQDCGCFGEALHLTNWETFFKNIILLICAIIIYLQRDKFEPIASSRWKYLYIACYTSIIFGISIYALRYIPQIDFGTFKAGTKLAFTASAQPEQEYETVFTYAKDGQEKLFTLENLPDSTWTFVKSDTKLVSTSFNVNSHSELILKNSDGVYVTDEIIESDNPVFVLSVYDCNKINERDLEKIITLHNSITSNGAEFYILSGNSPEDTEALFSTTGYNCLNTFDILYTDYKSTLSLNRSNAGLTYIDNSHIVKKWSSNNYPKNIRKLLDEVSEVLTASVTIKEQLFAEITIAFILFLIAIVRFISKRIYNKEPIES